MNTEQRHDLAARAAVHAALADPARLLITDALGVGDASPSELAALLGMPSNLLAHHLGVLEQAGLVSRRRSEGDRRRTYLRLVPGALDPLAQPPARTAHRVLFVCTANSARSHLAAALWRRASEIPAASAGTRPAAAIDPGAIAAAGRHHLPLRRLRPRHIDQVRQDGDLVVTVCDLAREELGGQAAVHWSVPDPVTAADPGSFDAALADLGQRVGRLAPRLTAAPPACSTQPGPQSAAVLADRRETAGTVRDECLGLRLRHHGLSRSRRWRCVARGSRCPATGRDGGRSAPWSPRCGTLGGPHRPDQHAVGGRH